jgi:polar amino acid transport system substrate-binding protein
MCLVLGAALAAAALAIPASAAITPPRTVATAGKIVFCSDMTYPPEESLHAGRPVGSDIDVATAVARPMGVGARFVQVGFDGLIPALVAKRCDAIISGMTDNAARRTQVDFADYMNLGSSLMVPRGDPLQLGSLASLSGRSVAVQDGTTELDLLTSLNARLAKQGKPPVVISRFAKDPQAAAALAAGTADAYLSDDLGVLFHVQQSKGRYEVAASGIDAAPIGIATRKSDPLGPAVRKAIDRLYSDGTMASILAKWSLGAFALRS